MARLSQHHVNAPTQIWEGTRLIESANDILPVTTTSEAEPLSFERLVELYESRVRRLTYRLLGWRDEVDDVTQDVFLAVFRSSPRFRGDAQLWTWLMRITINQCRTRQRKRFVQWKALKRLWKPDETTQPIPDDGDETKRRVQQAVAQLSEKDREVIVLYYFEQMDVKHMSELLAMSIGNVNVRLHRGRERLRRALAELMKDEL